MENKSERFKSSKYETESKQEKFSCFKEEVDNSDKNAINGNAKNPPLNRPPKKKIALKCNVKQSKNGKSTSNYKASPINCETQNSLRI